MTDFKNGIVSLGNKHFGLINETLVKSLFDLQDSGHKHFDLKDGQLRIEVKFSRAKRKERVGSGRPLDVIMRPRQDELIYLHEALDGEPFSCNLQHIKPSEFDLLFYGVYFADRVLVFLLTKDDLQDPLLCFGRQSLGNVLERQFRVDNRNLAYHMRNYLLLTLSFSDTFHLFNESPA